MLFRSEAGFPARGKQDSDSEGDRMGVTKEPPTAMNKKDKKVIPGGKNKDEVQMNPPLRVDEAKAKLHRAKKPRVERDPERPEPGVTRQLSKIIKEKKIMTKDEDPCWSGYRMIGMKDKGGKRVPNCVPSNEDTSASREMGSDSLRKTYSKDTPGQTEEIDMAHYSPDIPWQNNEERDTGKTPKLYEKVREVLSGKIRKDPQ